jgi:hypothetical protein
MSTLVKIDPHEDGRKRVIEMLEEQLELAKAGNIISISICTVAPDLGTTTHLATEGWQTLMIGAMYTQLYRLAANGWEDA